MNYMDHNIHVLLVDHDSEYHDTIKNFLHKYSCRVTSVKLASTALSVLSSENNQFDVMIANMNSPDNIDGFQLLRDAVKMNVLVILVSSEDDAFTTMRALQEGAFLCIKKEATMEIMEGLWEHVVWESVNTRIQNNNHDADEKRVTKSCKKASSRVRNRVWIRWTNELHQKFIDAVKELGDGRCFPKEIQQLMNEPGLTRMQVASHLQICRNSKWVPPGEKKPKQNLSLKPTLLKNKAPIRSKMLRIGSMPRFGEPPQEIQEYHEINHENLTIDPPRQITNFDDHIHINGGLDEDSIILDPLMNNEINALAQNNESFNLGPNDSDIIHGFAILDTIIQDLYDFQYEEGINYDKTTE
ncbi:hypothetical protein CASFOL_038228 [Castilleja foliolosa]|uniref:Uncharacterized protein n=1 Tax=Castilleja foliolosa TaxID=1961234 RepID=A0ABD3BKU0_9LAMI